MCNYATLRNLVWMDKRNKRHPSFVRDARLHVIGVHLQEQARHASERGRPPSVHAVLESRLPSQQKKVSVIRVVVRVLVRDENVANSAQRHSGSHELDGSISAVHNVGCIVHQNHLRGRRSTLSRPRPAGRPRKISLVLVDGGICPRVNRGFRAASASAAPTPDVNCRREELRIFPVRARS